MVWKSIGEVDDNLYDPSIHHRRQYFGAICARPVRWIIFQEYWTIKLEVDASFNLDGVVPAERTYLTVENVNHFLHICYIRVNQVILVSYYLFKMARHTFIAVISGVWKWSLCGIRGFAIGLKSMSFIRKMQINQMHPVRSDMNCTWQSWWLQKGWSMAFNSPGHFSGCDFDCLNITREIWEGKVSGWHPLFELVRPFPSAILPLWWSPWTGDLTPFLGPWAIFLKIFLKKDFYWMRWKWHFLFGL